MDPVSSVDSRFVNLAFLIRDKIQALDKTQSPASSEVFQLQATIFQLIHEFQEELKVHPLLTLISYPVESQKIRQK